jgi:hypothetical protein
VEVATILEKKMQVMGVGPLWFDGSVSMQHNGYGVGMSIRPASRVRDARQVNFQPRRGGRAVECTGLENRRWSDPTVGSNPTLSARKNSGFCIADKAGKSPEIQPDLH